MSAIVGSGQRLRECSMLDRDNDAWPWKRYKEGAYEKKSYAGFVSQSESQAGLQLPRLGRARGNSRHGRKHCTIMFTHSIFGLGSF